VSGALNEIEIRSVSSGIEISRRSKTGGMVNLGRSFTPGQVEKVQAFVAGAGGEYLTWEKHWKPFLRKLK
jgi:hypothetical protein